MDTIQTIPQAQSISPTQPLGGSTFAPGIFPSVVEGNEYLSSLDSDTRDYVMKHTGDFRSRGDVVECVKKLRGES